MISKSLKKTLHSPCLRSFGYGIAIATALAVAPAFAETQGISDTEIKLGGQHDFSGVFAAFSVPAVKAAELYFKEINEKGGIHGRKITYITEDHGYNPAKAVQLVNKLVNKDKVFAMFLSLGTPMNLAGFKIQDPKGIPNIAPLTAARQIMQEPLDLHYTSLGFYYNGIRDGVNWMAKNEGADTFCSMYLPTDFGTEAQAGAKDEAAELGLNYATETTHKPDETDFVGPLQKMKEANCDVVITALGVKQTITLLGTAKKLGLKDMKFMGTSASFHTVISKIPGGITEGFYAASGWQDLEARMGDPVVAGWVKKYTEATGKKFPSTGALLGRSAAELLVRALEAAGKDLTHESFQKAMESLSFEDKIAGNMVKMGPGDHVASEAVYVSKIDGGSWKLLATIE